MLLFILLSSCFFPAILAGVVTLQADITPNLPLVTGQDTINNEYRDPENVYREENLINQADISPNERKFLIEVQKKKQLQELAQANDLVS